MSTALTSEVYATVKAERDVALESLKTVRSDIARLTMPPPPIILVVDDDENALYALATELEQLSGLEIVRCSDPEKALELLETNDYAGVVLDLHLSHPEINGAMLGEFVPRTRVLAMISGDPDVANLAACMGAMWLGKPYMLREPAERREASALRADTRPSLQHPDPNAASGSQPPPEPRPESSLEMVAKEVLFKLRGSFS